MNIDHLTIHTDTFAQSFKRPAHAIDMANSKEVQHMTFRIREELESGQSELPHQSEVLGRIDADRDNPDVSLFETIET